MGAVPQRDAFDERPEIDVSGAIPETDAITEYLAAGSDAVTGIRAEIERLVPERPDQLGARRLAEHFAVLATGAIDCAYLEMAEIATGGEALFLALSREPHALTRSDIARARAMASCAPRLSPITWR